MSGGFFDYQERRIEDIADSIEEVIRDNKKEKSKEDLFPWNYDSDGKVYDYCKYYYGYSDETVKLLKKALQKLREAAIYAKRVDYLLSGDDGEDTFKSRLEKELEDLKNNSKKRRKKL